MASGIWEIAGWLGAVLYVSAYLLLTAGKLKADSFLYHFLNILGAVCLIINAFHFSDYPNVVTNLLWLGIGIVAVIALGVRRKRSG